MDKDTRNAIERATQRARKLLEDDFASQLEGTFDVLRAGTVAAKAGAHLTPRQIFDRDKILAAIEHKRAAGMSAADAVVDYLRDAAFTALNRFVALKMLEARELVQECITKGEQSAGYREFCGLAPGVALLPESAGYRLYIESLFDELSTEVKVLFDRRDPASVLWPKRATFETMLDVLNATELVSVWGEDETIGWVYQYFNSIEERQAMKDVKSGGSQAPRNSRELATRNQFFTPRYIVRFLTDNTLGRLWWEMRGGDTALRDRCEFLTVKPGVKPQERTKKDPRDIRVLDPACGSGHFLLYAFELLLCIYEEAWADPSAPTSAITGRALRDDYPSTDALHAAVPELIVRHNLFGVDIDARCVQVASFALWLRAQRAWSELRVPRGSRPRVEHSHVILAEPMPGDTTLVREFANQVGHPVLAQLFERIVEAFKLAGDLGILLRVDRLLEDAIHDAERSSRQATLFGAGATSQVFWDTAETRLLEELARFALGGPSRDHERRRLFRHDSAHGLALLDAARTKFDVVLMNPPFGDPSGPSKDYVEGAYPDSRQDISTVFVDRAVRDLAPAGLVGVISAEAGLFRRTLEPWRRKVLLACSRVEVLAHLGGHVLDNAIVRVAAYALSTSAPTASSLYIRVVSEPRDARDKALQEAISNVRRGLPSGLVFETDQREFEKLPYAVFGYWCSPELRDVFVKNEALEGAVGRARQGLATADDFRFLRLKWEVDPSNVRSDAWMPFAKGGDYSPFYDDIHLVLAWQRKGREIIAWGKGRPQNMELFGRQGITWPRRTAKRFSPRPLPSGCAFGDKGPAIVDCEATWEALALLNSRVIAYFLGLGLGMSESEGGAGANSYEVGLVQRLPVPKDLMGDLALHEQAQEAWIARAEGALRDETTSVFAGPAAPFGLRQTLSDTWNEVVALEERRLGEYVTAQEKIDRRTCQLYGLTDKDWLEIEESAGAVHRPEVVRDDRARGRWAETFVSFLVGSAFGRWDPSRLTATTTIDTAQAFVVPEGHRDEIRDAPAILVDDPGHSFDIAQRCETALETIAGERTHRLLSEVSTFVGVDDLRRYFRTQFFGTHIKTYTKSRRTAPIFLPLATQSGEYTIWLYLLRIGPDTLFTVQSEIVSPKLRLEEGRLAATRADGATGASGRKQLADQQTIVDELRGFADEIKRVAPLWKPDLDDGVLITFAPLWRLVPHNKSWQKDLKVSWDALCAGDYDWSHLAMQLWPERVVPKCAADRSLAIAHGVEDVFWAEGADGKWKPRTTPSMSVDQLVSERSSSAVKAALKSLLDAPTASGTGRARGRRAAASATTDGGVS